MRGSNVLSIVLIIAIAALLGWLSQRFAYVADWTYANRASLTEASQRVVDALGHGPIEFTAFAHPGAGRKRIRVWLAPYLRAADNVQLTFVDPALHPARIRELGIEQTGAVRVTYDGRSEILHRLREPSVTQALQRLSVAHEQWVAFLTGHGERNLAADGPSGYSELAQALDAQGLAPRELDLAKATAIPDKTAVLVIAGPQSELVPGEIDMIRHYLQHGGNLLWLRDPNSPDSLAAIADMLSIDWQTGTLIYPDYRRLGTGHPAMALVTEYPQTAITEHLNRLTLFPLAGAVTIEDNGGWAAQPFVRSAARSWLETQKLKRGTLTFQPDQGDQEGPLTIGLMLSRRAADSTADSTSGTTEQRVAVIADSDFITNEFINTLGNRVLGIAVFQWLAHRDAQIAVDVTGAPDASLQLAPGTTRSLWYIFVVLLPLGLLLAGISRWATRRRR